MKDPDQPTPRDETPFSVDSATGAPVADAKTLADATDAMIELGDEKITEAQYHERIHVEVEQDGSVEIDVTSEPPTEDPEAAASFPETTATVVADPSEGVPPGSPSDGEATDPSDPNTDPANPAAADVVATEDDQTQATSSGGATVASTDAAPESVALVEATPPQE